MNLLKQVCTANHVVRAGVALTGLSMIATTGMRKWIAHKGGDAASQEKMIDRLRLTSMGLICLGSSVAMIALLFELNPHKFARIKWLGVEASSGGLQEVWQITPLGSATIGQIKFYMFLPKVIAPASIIPLGGTIGFLWGLVSESGVATLLNIVGGFVGAGIGILATGGILTSDLYKLGSRLGQRGGLALAIPTCGIWLGLGVTYYDSLRSPKASSD